MSYKSKKAKGLSLTFKEEFELSKLFISSYEDNKININNIFYNFPICVLGQIIFEDGILVVPKEKINLQKLLSLYHPLKNKLYYEYKPAVIAEDEVEELELEIDALNAARNMDIDQAEAIMRVEVVTPEDYMGDVIGDLNSRRGQISTQEQRGNATVITAMVPLANMFGYINSLRSMSQGRAQYSMFFDHYDKVPQNVQDEVTKKTG